jgi:formylglycine-generating enzyme required for sulfatase activity
MQAFARDLRAYLEGRVVGAYETGAVAEFKKWVSRNRALALTSLSAGTIIVGGLAIASLVLARKNTQLSAITAEAVASAELAAKRAAKVLRLSDVKRLQQLAQRADELWPAHPENAEALKGWLASARDLLGREDLHRAELARLRGRAGAAPGPPGASEQLAFESAEDQWQHDTLVDLARELARLRDAEHGLVGGVEARLRFAESVEERTRSGPEARRLWREAQEAISASPAYAGLELAPQLGLLPLGPDPRSGLLEFAHLETGAPARRAASGELELTAESGLVFVLLPGGPFRLGMPTGPQGAETAEPAALEVELAPFFSSKYEMTQGQWLRFTGDNPSRFVPGQEFGGRPMDLLHPVEQVSWVDCRGVLERLALDLPSEAQWEYAARAGTEDPWWTGSERESLRGRANLADQSAERIGAGWPAIADWPELEDGHAVHAPVNAFEPNPFGLFNTVGNVWEWCRDPYAPAYGDVVTELYPTRGGSFQHTADLARSSHRNPTSPDLRIMSLGVRPARALDP